MYWLEVRVSVDGEAAEAVSEALRPYAHQQSVVLEQLGDQTDLDPQALEPEIAVKIYIPGDEDSPQLRRKLEEILFHMSRLYPIPPPTFHELADEDWAHAWKKNYRPFRVGKRIWIQPSWLPAESPDETDIVITLDPGMAFGTGLHPTTQMCLQALENYLSPGERVLDVGTGSGILGAAAAKLGASQVLGLDTDAVAVKAAGENGERNGVAGIFSAQIGDLSQAPPNEKWDIVVVNILAPVILAMLRQNDLLGYVENAGKLILSGIIDEQVDEVRQAVESRGGAVVEQIGIRDWVALVVQPKKDVC